jgi:HD-GYP domain-containing protein (c-di-GMP phosphodiesterase class II)
MPDDIRQAQLDLGNALNRARAGEDKALARKVREFGEQFTRLFYGMLRMTRIHALDNRAFEEPLEDLSTSLKGLWELLGAVHLICVEDQIYLNDVRIRFEMGSEHVAGLGEELKRHSVGGVSFNAALSKDEIRRLVKVLMEKPAPSQRRLNLQSKLNEANLGSIELHAVFRFRVKGDADSRINRDFAQVYQQSAGTIAEAYANLLAERMPNPLPVRRMVNELIDSSGSVDAAKMAREHDESLPNFARHTLMVTALSILIGREAGLSEAALGDIGVSAMFHDVGVSMREGGYPVPFERHGSAGLRTLLKQRGFHEAKIRRLLATVEHHRNYDHKPLRPTMTSRVIHIADDYDILTRYRPGRGPILSHPDAVARMATQGGTRYDPILLQCLVNAIGLFPPGAILRLQSGLLVVSISGVRSPDTFAKPLCRVLRDADNKPVQEEVIVDLAVEDAVRRVVQPTA